MIGEAVDTAITLGWALAAWIAVLAAVGSVVLLAGTAVGMWAVRGAWRALRRPGSRPCGSRAAGATQGTSRAHVAPRWAAADPQGTPDVEEAA